MDDYERFLNEQLKDPEFKKEWDASQLEFEITEMIIAARHEQNLSQKELAAKSGIRQSNISRIENGQCVPNLNTLQRIAAGLGKKVQIQFV
ncbi:helix-turn-helix domain-containing protein [Anaerovibrio sp. RM50]|uniref:helix-turn-helix domain-containing protein n=1 Tax=Anaerovibrio sp. RM50 TaxID=1200557 RepID=UPI000489BBAC|nr:helix-turn-helix transcriptional regulator [Anaerovibrio sp. RM50]